eukprot:CAMPEP_0203987882 /NCGR_PEP_ID=MMETSP0360-20130528/7078_1 /ASSEMBLY_ACC=CAM_ASM_000342 /TAXON_ID=268821 /ORGANISM="Scrippsiella Hangoei, Strain SHTV-5" /LENGTH=109 /DNA_ID=CAMNT_0050927573 /DNA_START=131 /DNA_END=456 /DNA_ORIENTATION=+
MTTSFASRFAADIRNAVSGKGTPADKRTITVLALALLCAAAPLDISQLAMLLVGAAAYAAAAAREPAALQGAVQECPRRSAAEGPDGASLAAPHAERLPREVRAAGPAP